MPALRPRRARGVQVIPAARRSSMPKATRHVEGVAVADIDGRRRRPERAASGSPCDLVLMSVGYSPGSNLASYAGARIVYDPAINMHRAVELPPGLSLAGAAAGIWDGAAVLRARHARPARAAAALALGKTRNRAARRPAIPTPRGITHPYPIFAHRQGKDFVDFDEDLQVKDIVNTVEGRLRRHPAGEALLDGRHRPEPGPPRQPQHHPHRRARDRQVASRASARRRTARRSSPEKFGHARRAAPSSRCA